MSEADWRWADGGQEREGPVGELLGALARGEVGPATRVRRADWTEWRAAIDVAELFPGAAETASSPGASPVIVAPILPLGTPSERPPGSAAAVWSAPISSPPRPVPSARATLGFQPPRPAATGAEMPRRVSQAMTRTDLTAAPDLEAVDRLSDEDTTSESELSMSDIIEENQVDEESEIDAAFEALELATPNASDPPPPKPASLAPQAPPLPSQATQAANAQPPPAAAPQAPRAPSLAPQAPPLPSQAKAPSLAPQAPPLPPQAKAPSLAPQAPPLPSQATKAPSLAPQAPPLPSQAAKPLAPQGVPGPGGLPRPAGFTAPAPAVPPPPAEAAPSTGPTTQPAEPPPAPAADAQAPTPVDGGAADGPTGATPSTAPAEPPADAPASAPASAQAPSTAAPLARVAVGSIPVVVENTGTYRSVAARTRPKVMPVVPVPVVAVAPTPAAEAPPPAERPSNEPRLAEPIVSKTTTLIGQSPVDLPDSNRSPAPAAGSPAPAARVATVVGHPAPPSPVDPLAATVLPDAPSPLAASPEGETSPEGSSAPTGAPLDADEDDPVPPISSPLQGKLPLVVGGAVLLAVVVGAIVALRPSPAPQPPTAPSASASVSVAPTPPTPPPAPKLDIRCKRTDAPSSVVRKAVVAAGVEVLAHDETLAVGFASADTVAQVVRLGTNLAPTAAATVTTKDPLRRVQPVLRAGKLEASAEVDAKVGGVASRRVVDFDPPFFIGVSDKGIAEAREGAAPKELFPLLGEGPVEALRVSHVGPQRGVALAFRQGGAIYAGVAIGEELSPRGGLEKAAGLGRTGVPSVAVSGDDWLVVYADRFDAAGPWSLRLIGGKLGGAGGASAPKTFELPKAEAGDGAIAPSLVSLGRGAFLLAWTGGPASAHQVRAQVIDGAGVPAGEAFDVSERGANAGQARGAVNAAGRGALVYFAAKDADYELLAAPITCGKEVK